MKETFRHDLFESTLPFLIEEAKGDVNGQCVLGKIKGTFFVPDGVSRNNRYYSKGLWETTLSKPDIQTRIKERRMFGTISHEQALDDKALLEGRISHIVTDLAIERDGISGFGEALILDTPAGRILNTFLRAGSKLFVSSRANGSFRGEMKGVPNVDPESYDLGSFDFVMDPGFLQANPQLAESLNKVLAEIGEEKKKPANNSKGESKMENNQLLLENILKEKAKMEADLERSLSENEKLRNENTSLKEENTHFSEEMKKLEEMDKNLKAYEELGTPDEISQAIDISEKRFSELKELGTIQELTEVLDKAESLLNSYESLGTPGEIDECLDKCKQAVAAYRELGSPSEIALAFDKLESFVESAKNTAATKRITELSAELGVSEDAIKKVYGKLTEEEIKDVFSKVQESSNFGSRFRKNEETKPINEKKEIEIKSRGQRLMESFNR